MATTYDLYSVYDEDQSDLLATFVTEGDEEKIIEYIPSGDSEDWLKEPADKGWTTQEFLMYFPRGTLVKTTDRGSK